MPETDDNFLLVPVEGQVWCWEHGAIHADTTNPHDDPGDTCEPREHREVYLRAVRGDLG
jgi:hypothetical protein